MRRRHRLVAAAQGTVAPGGASTKVDAYGVSTLTGDATEADRRTVTRNTSVYVYEAPVRLWHWITALSIIVLLTAVVGGVGVDVALGVGVGVGVGLGVGAGGRRRRSPPRWPRMCLRNSLPVVSVCR